MANTGNGSGEVFRRACERKIEYPFAWGDCKHGGWKDKVLLEDVAKKGKVVQIACVKNKIEKVFSFTGKNLSNCKGIIFQT